MSEKPGVIQQLRGVIGALEQEGNGLLIMGRGLSPEERRRSDHISKALPKLREGLEILTTEPLSEDKSGP